MAICADDASSLDLLALADYSDEYDMGLDLRYLSAALRWAAANDKRPKYKEFVREHLEGGYLLHQTKVEAQWFRELNFTYHLNREAANELPAPLFSYMSMGQDYRDFSTRKEAWECLALAFGKLAGILEYLIPTMQLNIVGFIK